MSPLDREELARAIRLGMTMNEAAEELGITRARVHQLVSDGRIEVIYTEPHGSTGRHWVSRKDVRRLVKQREQGTFDTRRRENR